MSEDARRLAEEFRRVAAGHLHCGPPEVVGDGSVDMFCEDTSPFANYWVTFPPTPGESLRVDINSHHIADDGVFPVRTRRFPKNTVRGITSRLPRLPQFSGWEEIDQGMYDNFRSVQIPPAGPAEILTHLRDAASEQERAGDNALRDLLAPALQEFEQYYLAESDPTAAQFQALDRGFARLYDGLQPSPAAVAPPARRHHVDALAVRDMCRAPRFGETPEDLARLRAALEVCPEAVVDPAHRWVQEMSQARRASPPVEEFVSALRARTTVPSRSGAILF